MNKIISKLLIVLILAGVLGCAPSIKRSGYHAPSPVQSEECEVLFVRDGGELDTTPKLGTISIHKSIFHRNFSEQQAIDLVRREACLIGANRVNFTVSIKPSLFCKTCFTVYADLYREE